MEEDKAHFGPRKGKETADVQLRTFQAGGKIMDISYTLARGDSLSQNKYEKKRVSRGQSTRCTGVPRDTQKARTHRGDRGGIISKVQWG